MLPSFSAAIYTGQLTRAARQCAGALALLLAVSGVTGRAWALDHTVTSLNKNGSFVLYTGEKLTIGTNVTFGGSITVVGNNAVITNYGTVSSNGSITVNSNISGTVLNNLKAVSTNNVFLNSPTTVNNGSADGGTTVVASAVWTSTIADNFKTTTTISNYAKWAGQLGTGFSGTINNRGTWAVFTEPGGPTTINNSGTWNGGQVNYSGSLTINHTAGSWNADLNPGPGASLTINNSGTWTRGFNFSNTGPNRFVNNAGATVTLDAYLGMGGSTAIANRGAMVLKHGMGDIAANSSLTNERDATFRVTGQFVNYGTVSNAGIISASQNFVNNSTGVVTGPAAPLRGSITAGDYTVNEGTFGVVGQLDFCSSSKPTAGFSAQRGTVGPNTTFCSARPLPVELTSFTAEVVKGQVQLRWATASEQNSDKFVVERSTNGEVFETVREVAAQGNSTYVTIYVTLDARPVAGTSYYRLRQVDRDGALAFSPLARLSFAAPSQPLACYPNPVADRLTLDLTPAGAEPCAVRVLSLTGQVVRAETLPGGRLQELSLAALPAGLYLLQVRTPQGSSVQRIEKR